MQKKGHNANYKVFQHIQLSSMLYSVINDSSVFWDLIISGQALLCGGLDNKRGGWRNKKLREECQTAVVFGRKEDFFCVQKMNGGSFILL